MPMRWSSTLTITEGAQSQGAMLRSAKRPLVMLFSSLTRAAENTMSKLGRGAAL